MKTMAVVGYGFIGRRIALLAGQRDWRVRALSRQLATAPEDPEHEVTEGDAADPGVLSRLFDGADHVVFAAGTAKPAESNAHPMHEFSTNLQPLLSTLDLAVRGRVQGLTFLSSAGTVYGPEAPVPTGEDAPLWPRSSYGIIKVTSERYVALYARQFGFAADILRCANAFGPGEPTTGSQGVIGVARTALENGLPVRLYGDGSARRDFVHVDDVADAVERLARCRESVRVLNVGAGRSVSVREIVDALAEGLEVEPVLDVHPARPTDAPRVELDIRRLRQVIDFDPRDVRQVLRDSRLAGRMRG